MARIRTIKPEFWRDEKIMDCAPVERLLFIGLWGLADDYGRYELAPRNIRAELFAEDEISSEQVRGMLMDLSAKGLITVYSAEGKDYFYVTNWDKHQRIDNKAKPKYPSPFGIGPSQEKREQENPSEPSQILARNSEDSGKKSLEGKGKEKEGKRKKNSRLVADATQPSEPSKFEEFWKSYPRRDGPNPRKPAEQKFNALVKTGVDPDLMVAAAKRLAVDEAKRSNIGTRFIPQAITWLNQQRWTDHAAVAFSADDGLIEVLDQMQLEAWDAHGIATRGRPYPRDRKGGWRFPSKWPPGYEANLMADVEKLISDGRSMQ